MSAFSVVRCGEPFISLCGDRLCATLFDLSNLAHDGVMRCAVVIVLAEEIDKTTVLNQCVVFFSQGFPFSHF